MPRSDAYAPKLESPVKRYLSWSSNDKTFTYYDKDKSENVKVKLPLQIIHLEEFATIKGYHEKSASRIYSNEVKNVKNSELVVRSYKSPTTLVSGIYSQIKPTIEAVGGHYAVSIYVVLPDGSLGNISMKGSSLKDWSDFCKDNRKSFLTNYIKIESASDQKKGAVKYSVPVFALGDEITEAKAKESDDLFDELQAYFKARKANAEAASIDATNEEHVEMPTMLSEPFAVAEQVDDSDPLPF